MKKRKGLQTKGLAHELQFWSEGPLQVAHDASQAIKQKIQILEWENRKGTEEKSWPLQTPKELTKEFEFEQEDKQEDPSRTNPETQLKHPVDSPFWHVAQEPSQPLKFLSFI